jgi:hypothetical protein
VRYSAHGLDPPKFEAPSLLRALQIAAKNLEERLLSWYTGDLPLYNDCFELSRLELYSCHKVGDQGTFKIPSPVFRAHRRSTANSQGCRQLSHGDWIVYTSQPCQDNLCTWLNVWAQRGGGMMVVRQHLLIFHWGSCMHGALWNDPAAASLHTGELVGQYIVSTASPGPGCGIGCLRFVFFGEVAWCRIWRR